MKTETGVRAPAVIAPTEVVEALNLCARMVGQTHLARGEELVRIEAEFLLLKSAFLALVKRSARG